MEEESVAVAPVTLRSRSYAPSAARSNGRMPRACPVEGHKSPHILLNMLKQAFEWDTCQMPVNVMDAHYRSFQNEVLPELTRRGIGCIGMKSLGGDGQMIGTGLTPEQARGYALSL